MLPSLKPAGDRPEAMAATGTDASHANTLAPILIQSGVVSGRGESLPDVITLSDALGWMKAEPPEKEPSDASVRVQTAPDGSVPKVGLEPAPSCEDGILSPARLPSVWDWAEIDVTLISRVFPGFAIAPAVLAAVGVERSRGEERDAAPRRAMERVSRSLGRFERPDRP
jgi:hypothetical protein